MALHNSLTNLNASGPSQAGMMMGGGMVGKSQSLNNLQTVAEVEPAKTEDEKLTTEDVVKHDTEGKLMSKQPEAWQF